MATRIFKDGDFEITITTHGKPDPHIAAQAILPLVIAALEREMEQKQNATGISNEKPGNN